MRKLLPLAFFLLCTHAVHAQCTGSSPSWSCAAGTTSAQLASALSAAGANDGDVFTFAAGSYTWSSMASFQLTKGATLICATAPPSTAPFGAATTGGCNVSVTGNCVLGMNTFSGSGQYFPFLYRISGFNFTPTSGSNAPICWPSSPTAINEGTFTQLRFDHNTFNDGTPSVAINLSTSGHRIYLYGVIDHNNLLCAGNCLFTDYAAGVDPLPAPAPLGTFNNIFLEDDYLTMTTMTNSGEGCIDDVSSADLGSLTYGVVVRHSQSTNCDWTGHPSPMNYEFYNNTVIQNANSANQDCFLSLHLQSVNLGAFFNNTFTCNTSPNSDVMEFKFFRGTYKLNSPKYPFTLQCDGFVNFPPLVDGNRSPSATNQGYPCYGQPGRDLATKVLIPLYAWNNTKNAALAQLTGADAGSGNIPDYFNKQLQNNRDWFNAASASAQSSPTVPFNGTSGVGFGTLANRPTTCTTNANEAGTGVGYFATDQGTQGILYTCSSTNTWTQVFQPAPYPHYLVAGTAITAFPTFSIAPGPYLTTQTVTVSDASPSPTLFCTTDGTVPTHSSPSFSSPHAFTVSQTATINCLAASGVLLDSLILSGGFWINQTANNPEPDPPGGSFPTGTLTVRYSNPGQLVRNCITDDGSTPTSSGLNDGNCGHTHITSGSANSTNQFSTVNVSATTTIKVLMTGKNFNDSPIQTTTFTVGGTNGLWWQDGPSENFGNQVAGVTSGTLPVLFTNPGSTSTTVSAVSVAGTGFSNAGGGSCANPPFTINAGSFCTILLNFTPPSNGTFTGTLTLTDNVAGSPHVIPLNGTGLGGAIASFTPSPVNIGLVPQSLTSNPVSVTMQNIGTATLTNTAINLSNAFFTIVNNTCGSPATITNLIPGTGFTLAPNATCTFGVTASPTAVGSATANAVFLENTNTGSDTLVLNATGTGPPAPTTIMFAGQSATHTLCPVKPNTTELCFASDCGCWWVSMNGAAYTPFGVSSVNGKTGNVVLSIK